jgi:hypothetical protein
MESILAASSGSALTGIKPARREAAILGAAIQLKWRHSHDILE